MRNLENFYSDLKRHIAGLNKKSNNEFQINTIKKNNKITVTYRRKIPSILGDVFYFVIQERRAPVTDKIFGLAIDYFDSKSHGHYFISSADDSIYYKGMKILAVIWDEINSGEIDFRYSRYHVAK